MPSDDERARTIQAMFGRLVPQYDRMNRVMTAGLDGRWRRLAVDAAAARGGRCARSRRGYGRPLPRVPARGRRPSRRRRLRRRDAACARARSSATRRPAGSAPTACSCRSPTPASTPSRAPSCCAIWSTCRARSRRCCASSAPAAAWSRSTSPILPPTCAGASCGSASSVSSPQSPGCLSGDWNAYRYLPSSLAGYPPADELASMMRAAGATDVSYRRLAGGAVALHTGRKPSARSHA